MNAGHAERGDGPPKRFHTHTYVHHMKNPEGKCKNHAHLTCVFPASIDCRFPIDINIINRLFNDN